METLSFSTTTPKEVVAVQGLVSSPKQQAIGEEEMASSCTRGLLGFHIRKKFFTERVV